MTPTDLATIETALARPSIDEDAAVSAIEALSALRTRDWAVRVLVELHRFGNLMCSEFCQLMLSPAAALSYARHRFFDLPQGTRASLGEAQ